MNATTKVTPNPKLGMSARKSNTVTQRQHLFSPKTATNPAKFTGSRTMNTTDLVTGFGQISTPTCLLKPSPSPNKAKKAFNVRPKVDTGLSKTLKFQPSNLTMTGTDTA